LRNEKAYLSKEQIQLREQAELASTRLIATKSSSVPTFMSRDAAPALETFLSRKNGVTLVHGPKGTGKSSLIKQTLTETNRHTKPSLRMRWSVN
jgi:type II secretory ATPase GspE/PulE/Tfp pilus assembly ATPase PilB-like protein